MDWPYYRKFDFDCNVRNSRITPEVWYNIDQTSPVLILIDIPAAAERIQTAEMVDNNSSLNLRPLWRYLFLSPLLNGHHHRACDVTQLIRWKDTAVAVII